MKKLPAKYNVIAMPFVLSVMMSCIISGVSTLMAIGIIDAFFSRWMTAWAISWAVAFPTLLVLLPIVRKIVAQFVEVPSAPRVK